MKKVGYYAIMQHRKGYDTDEDHLVINRKTCKPYTYVFEESARTMCEMMQDANKDSYRFWVIRLD